MKKIVISGYYGFDNIGDDAMIETFANYFSNKKVEVTVLSKKPEETSKKFNVKSINRDSLFQIIKTIKESDILISGGGTLLQDITKVISIWYYLAILLIGIIYKKEVYVLFQGIGPINNDFNIWLTRKILSKVDYIVLRDNKALDQMKKLDFDVSRTVVATDLVFAMKMMNDSEKINLIKKYIPNYSKDKNYIGASLRTWKDDGDYIQFARLLNRMAKEYNAEIVFFPFHKAQDYRFTLKVIEKMENRCYLIFDDFLPSEMAGLMSLMDLNVGIRLHSLVFSILGDVPVAGITYDPKVDGFLKEFNMEPVATYGDIDIDKIMSKMPEILDRELVDEIDDKVDKNKEMVAKILYNVLEGKYKK